MKPASYMCSRRRQPLLGVNCRSIGSNNGVCQSLRVSGTNETHQNMLFHFGAEVLRGSHPCKVIDELSSRRKGMYKGDNVTPTHQRPEFFVEGSI